MLAETKFMLPLKEKEDLETPSIGKRKKNDQARDNSINFPF